MLFSFMQLLMSANQHFSNRVGCHKNISDEMLALGKLYFSDKLLVLSVTVVGGYFKLSAVFFFIGVNHGETSTIVNIFVIDRYFNLLSDTLVIDLDRVVVTMWYCYLCEN